VHVRTGIAVMIISMAMLGGCGRTSQTTAPAQGAASASTADAQPVPAPSQPTSEPATAATATAQDRGKPDVTRSLTNEDQSSRMPMAGQVNNHSTLDGQASTPVAK
jgi:hypothetical protein